MASLAILSVQQQSCTWREENEHQLRVPRTHLASGIPERTVYRRKVSELLVFQSLLELLAAHGVTALDVESAREFGVEVMVPFDVVSAVEEDGFGHC